MDKKKRIFIRPAFKITLLILAGVSLLIVFLIFIIYLQYSTMRALDFGYGTTTDLQKVDIEIAGQRYEIPKAFIWYRPNLRGGQQSGVAMHALLPEFKPYSKETEAEFKRRGHGRVISIHLAERGSYMSAERLFETMLKDAVGGEVEGPFGFRMYRLSSPWNTDLLFRYLEDGSLYFVKCKSIESALSPSCSRTIYLGDDHRVEYTYSRDYLEDRQEIDAGVLGFIKGFEVAQSTKKEKED